MVALRALLTGHGVAVAVLAAAGSTVALAVPVAGSSQVATPPKAKLSLSRRWGPPGTRVRLRGRGFPRRARIVLRFGGKRLRKVRAERSGRFRLGFRSRSSCLLRASRGTTKEIARAYLVSEPAVAQRIVRAKRTLSEARVPFEVPEREELADRLASVLEAIYLIFNEGYAATAGDDWIRPALLEEALRLGRILAGLAPEEPEVHGLVALMEIQASRSRARVDPSGDPVLLLDQDRARWDQLLIRRGLAALEQAEELSGALGPYTLQAAIAACHARARSGDETDWDRIVALYDALAELTRSPVVELNRAVAIAMAGEPDAGLEIVDGLVAQGALDGYHLLPAVRGDLLEKLGRREEARAEFELAASMTRNTRERDQLLTRVRSLQ